MNLHYQARARLRQGRTGPDPPQLDVFICAIAAAVGLLSSGTAVGIAFTVSVRCLALVVSLPLALSTVERPRGHGCFGVGRETVSLTL